MSHLSIPKCYNVKPTSYPSNLPTPLPTTSCGDNVCEASENDTSCPSDCGNLALTTNVAGDRGAQGTMFSVEATRDVVVTSFDLYSGSSATAQVQVYTRAGSYKGYELIEDGWTLVFDKGVQQFGRSTLSGIGPLTSEVAIAAGSVQSFYIYNANTVMYTLGTTEGNRKAFDESLAFYEGVGITNKFSGNTADLYIPRVFSGVMRYVIEEVILWCLMTMPTACVRIFVRELILTRHCNVLGTEPPHSRHPLRRCQTP